MDATAPSVIVVGAGIFGATGAAALASRGWSVRILDPGPLPRPDAATTDISKIVRMDYGDDGFYADLAARALEEWDRWNRGWNPPLYHPEGFLLLSRRGLVPGTFEQESHRTLVERGHRLVRLDPGVIDERFPAWRSGPFRGGYFNPRGGWAESGHVLTRVLNEARRRGVRVVPGEVVTGFLENGGRIAGVRTGSGDEHRADRVVVAAGAWTPGLLPELRDRMWATGQPVLHLQVDRPSHWQAPTFPPWAADIAETGWYGFPALDDGTLKIGHHGTGRRLDPDEPRIVAPEWEDRCRTFLRSALPGLADAPLVRTRLCLYCDTFDGDFLIDRHPEREGLVVAAGGSGHGFKFAPILGSLVADAVEEGDGGPRRFRWRPPGPERNEPARAGD